MELSPGAHHYHHPPTAVSSSFSSTVQLLSCPAWYFPVLPLFSQFVGAFFFVSTNRQGLFYHNIVTSLSVSVIQMNEWRFGTWDVNQGEVERHSLICLFKYP